MTSLYDEQRIQVLAALNLDPEIDVIKLLPQKVFSLCNSDELTKNQILEATRAFCLTLNLSSGNSGGRNLYLLNEMYLTDPEARNKINVILNEARASRFKLN